MLMIWKYIAQPLSGNSKKIVLNLNLFNGLSVEFSSLTAYV